MPHVGGGSSSSGGFHSGGHSSGTKIAPRKDIYGNIHRSFYFRPGFYFQTIYVPYSRVHRTFYAIRGFITLILLGIILIGFGISTSFIRVTSQALVDYSIQRYKDIYSSSEDELLIEIVAYDNLKEIDYLPIVGDNIHLDIDSMFGNQKSTFGGILFNELEQTEEKVTNIYSIVASSLTKTTATITKKYGQNSINKSRVYNNTTYVLGDDSSIKNALNEFYEVTGYSISLDISTFDQAYPRQYYMLIFLSTLGGVFIIYSIFRLIKALDAVKVINEADKNDDLEKYYEGEISFEEQKKRHSMDEPYKYNPKEFEELKKEFEIKKEDFEINEEEYKTNENEEDIL